MSRIGSAEGIGQRFGELLAKRDSSACPKTERPSGNCTPLIRNCTLACSPRTWIWPKLYCATPGICNRTIKRQDIDLVVIESTEAAAAFKGNFEAQFAIGAALSLVGLPSR